MTRSAEPQARGATGSRHGPGLLSPGSAATALPPSEGCGWSLPSPPSPQRPALPRPSLPAVAQCPRLERTGTGHGTAAEARSGRAGAHKRPLGDDDDDDTGVGQATPARPSPRSAGARPQRCPRPPRDGTGAVPLPAAGPHVLVVGHTKHPGRGGHTRVRVRPPSPFPRAAAPPGGGFRDRACRQCPGPVLNARALGGGVLFLLPPLHSAVAQGKEPAVEAAAAARCPPGGAARSGERSHTRVRTHASPRAAHAAARALCPSQHPGSPRSGSRKHAQLSLPSMLCARGPVRKTLCPPRRAHSGQHDGARGPGGIPLPYAPRL